MAWRQLNAKELVKTRTNRKRLAILRVFLLLVRKVGLEPTRPFERWNLNPVRLPISPLPRSSHSLAKDFESGMGYLAKARKGAD